MRIEAFVVSPFGSNCYVLWLDESEKREAVIVDPGDLLLDKVISYVEENNLSVEAVWNTHGHLDHVMGVDVIRHRFHVPAFLHEADVPLWDALPAVSKQWMRRDVPALAPPDTLWKDGDKVSLGRHEFTVWHTPGHSPGCICLVGETFALTGDTLFAGAMGRIDFPESDPQAMMRSLKRLLELPDHLTLYPGHMQSTTMGRERVTNPFLLDVQN